MTHPSRSTPLIVLVSLVLTACTPFQAPPAGDQEDTRMPDTEMSDTETPDTEMPDTEMPDTEMPLPLEIGEACLEDGECASEHCDASHCTPDDMRLIVGGEFTIGSPEAELGREDDETQQQVTIRRAMFVQEHEVTRGEWRGRMGQLPTMPLTCASDVCPVETVSWFDALRFANARSLAEGLEPCYELMGACMGSPPVGCEGGENFCYTEEVCAAIFEGLHCEGYRLPTEAEWEFLARAGTTTATPVGDLTSVDCPGLAGLSAIASYDCNSQGQPSPVGSFEPNAWGLYDMLGNVSEWVWSGYAAYPMTDLTDPLGPGESNRRVLRGGAFADAPEFNRAASRYILSPDFRGRTVGLRLVRTALIPE